MSPDNRRTLRRAYALSWLIVGGAAVLAGIIIAAIARLVGLL